MGKKRVKRVVIVSLLLLTFTSAVLAQDQPLQPFVIAEIATIHSKILGEDRSIFIYDPDKNGANLLPSYPVLYMLDENDMSLVTGLVKYLSSYTPNMPPMLVVGIPGAATRIRDLTPTHSLIDNLGQLDSSPDSWLKDSGGGEKFTQFVRDEVMPYVELHYKAGPFKILAGHSVGGLAAIDSLFLHPEMFDAYIAISPSLWWDKGYPLLLAKDKLSGVQGQKKFLFLADSPETGPFTGFVRDFDALMEARKPSALEYKHVFYPTESHGTIAAKAYYDGMRYLYPEWDIAESDTSAALIEQHYHAIGVRLGYDVQPPLGLVSDWGSDFLHQPGKTDDALELYLLNVKNFPRTASVYQDLGEGYAHKGNMHEAISAYKKALELAPNDSQIAQRLKDLQEKKQN
jgi:predicted alpha/beta superfamily hydrolase